MVNYLSLPGTYPGGILDAITPPRWKFLQFARGFQIINPRILLYAKKFKIPLLKNFWLRPCFKKFQIHCTISRPLINLPGNLWSIRLSKITNSFSILLNKPIHQSSTSFIKLNTHIALLLFKNAIKKQ